mmetsp:Transcript_41153/g.47450  ORF Transcript_41153/g.47450 Transcript_41153/m.47450 type:complete len:176 (+) Transcript_41153:130-657(+)
MFIIDNPANTMEASAHREYDHCDVCEKPTMYKKLGNGEDILWSAEVIKINKREKHQKRFIVVTSAAIYNLKPVPFLSRYFMVRRRIPLKAIACVNLPVTKSEFIVYHSSDKQKFGAMQQFLRIKSCHGAEFLHVLKSAFLNELHEKLPIYPHASRESVRCPSSSREEFQTKEEKC